jgi:DinB superfamily
MSTWNPQLVGVVCELEDATRSAQRLADRMSDAGFVRPPAPDKWSPGDCITHLTITNRAYLPLIRDGIAAAQALPPANGGRYRRDVMGWMLSRSLEPRAGSKTKTPHKFEPLHVRPRAEVLAEFIRSQRELAGLVAECNGLDLGHVKIRSPFSDKVSYNLYSCFKIIAAHERRHIAQAEGAARR